MKIQRRAICEKCKRPIDPSMASVVIEGKIFILDDEITNTKIVTDGGAYHSICLTAKIKETRGDKE